MNGPQTKSVGMGQKEIESAFVAWKLLGVLLMGVKLASTSGSQRETPQGPWYWITGTWTWEKSLPVAE